jgi:UDP-2,4-diacetamido-2,4,6-trideoxy-beta-L-altropyranose hydrolase
MLIRADANANIGGGHVMRCLSLAQAWQQCGGRTAMVTRSLPDSLQQRLTKEDVQLCPVPETDSPGDAAQLIEWADRLSADWLVLDGYEFTYMYQQAVHGSGRRVLWISDELGPADVSADLVLNQSPTAIPRQYAPMPTERCLLGLRYALLRAEFRHPRNRSDETIGEVRRVVVTFGQADPHSMLGAVLRSLHRVDPEHRLELEVVLPSLGERAKRYRDEFPHSSIRWHSNVANLVPLFQRADLAISAAGLTSYELAACGVPSLLIAIAENQEPVGRGLAGLGMAAYAGRQRDLGSATLDQSITELIADVGRRRKLSAQCQMQVDGNGAQRVVARMLSEMIRLRPVDPGDVETLFEWQQDRAVRQQSFTKGPADFAAHARWFGAKLNSPRDNFRMYMCEFPGGDAIGSIRFERMTGEWVVSLHLAPRYRGRGLGQVMLDAGSKRLRAETGASALVAFIKSDNIPSLRAFASCGFQRTAIEVIHGQIAQRWMRRFDEGTAQSTPDVGAGQQLDPDRKYQATA